MEEAVLRRDTAAAAWWSVLGVALVASGVFFVIDSEGDPVAWALLALFAVPALFFLVQLVWPGSVEVRLTRTALCSRSPFGRRSVAWEHVHIAEVRSVFGDRILVVEVRRPGGGTERVRVFLPVGADLDRLHRFLGDRLGRGSRLQASRSRPRDL